MFKKTLIFTLLIFIAIQFIPLEKTNPKVDDALTLHTDKHVMQILKKSCYDCHSNETKWSPYSEIAPLSFGVIAHVNDARKALNFSNYNAIDKEIKKARFKRAIVTLKNGAMPLGSYLAFHKEAQLTQDEKQILILWFEEQLKSF